MFKSLLPIFNDLWDHEFNEIKHIATIHVEYGSHHLQKEVADTESHHNQKSQNILKAEDQVQYHFMQKAFQNDCVFYHNEMHYIVFELDNFPFVLLPILAPPPKFSA